MKTEQAITYNQEQVDLLIKEAVEKAIRQDRELSCQTIRALPRQMNAAVKQAWIENPNGLQQFMVGLYPPEVETEHLIDFDKAPSVPSGWTILPDAEQLPNRVRGVLKFDQTQIVLHLDEGQKKGKVIEGNKLRKKLSEKPVFGAQLLDWYLVNPHLIPEDWKKDKVIFFWGTIYRDAGGSLYVRCLYWSGDGWDWNCYWLDGDWHGNYPAAVSAS